MSHIDDMLLFTGMSEDEAIARLNAWCAADDPERGQQFNRLDTDAAGGGKVFCSEVWAMAGNYFRSEKLVEALPTFGWRAPEDVVLLIDAQHDNCVRVYRAAPEREPSMW